MDLEEFETHYRSAMDNVLNQLQTMMLLVAQMEAKISEVGTSVQDLSERVETYVVQKQQEES